MRGIVGCILRGCPARLLIVAGIVPPAWVARESAPPKPSAVVAAIRLAPAPHSAGARAAALLRSALRRPPPSGLRLRLRARGTPAYGGGSAALALRSAALGLRRVSSLRALADFVGSGVPRSVVAGWAYRSLRSLSSALAPPAKYIQLHN